METNIKNAPVKTAEELVVYRARMMLFGALSILLWQFGSIVMDMIATPSNLVFKIAGWTSVVGAVSWVITTFFFFKFNSQMKKAKACSALHDELTLSNRNMAVFKSYIVLFGLIWLLIPLYDFWVYDAKIALRFIATIGVALPFILFASSELKNDDGAE
jgi:hypothetical protein